MGRYRRILPGLLGLVTLIGGCATNRPGNPFAENSTKSSTAPAAKAPAGDDSSLADGKNPPRASSNEKTSLAASPSDGGRSVAQAGYTSAAPMPRTDGHDPATQAYIEQELRDATPEEKTKLLTELRGQHSEAVRYILRTRRLAINSKQKPNEQELAARRATAAEKQTIQTVAGEVPGAEAGTQRRGSLAEGLGTVNAWPRQPPDTVPPVRSPVPQTTEKANWPRNAPAPPEVAGQGAVGHAAGFRVDPQADNPASPGGSAVHSATPPSANSAGGPASSAGQPATGPYSLLPAAAAATASLRSPALNKAAVAIATPMSTGQIGQQASGGVLAEGSAAGGAAREQLTRLISAAEAEAFEIQSGESELEKQAYIEKQVYLRMLYLMSGQQERAVQAIPGLEPADQEFWQQTFWGLTNYFDASSMPSAADRAAQTVTQMTNAVLRLQEKAKLELRNVTFCHKISSFGNYEKYARDEFSPGQEVLLYAEVANIHSEPITDGKFKTNLKSTIEIYRHGSQGELLERFDFPETVDICRTHRRDYFHSYQLTIPAKLALGPHVLKLSVEDQLSRRVGTYSLNFTVK